MHLSAKRAGDLLIEEPNGHNFIETFMGTAWADSRFDPPEPWGERDQCRADATGELISHAMNCLPSLSLVIHMDSMTSSSRSQCWRTNVSASLVEGSISKRLSASINKLEAM